MSCCSQLLYCSGWFTAVFDGSSPVPHTLYSTPLLLACCLVSAVLATAGEAWEQALLQQECRVYRAAGMSCGGFVAGVLLQ